MRSLPRTFLYAFVYTPIKCLNDRTFLSSKASCTLFMYRGLTCVASRIRTSSSYNLPTELAKVCTVTAEELWWLTHTRVTSRTAMSAATSVGMLCNQRWYALPIPAVLRSLYMSMTSYILEYAPAMNDRARGCSREPPDAS